MKKNYPFTNCYPSPPTARDLEPGNTILNWVVGLICECKQVHNCGFLFENTMHA